MANFPIAPSHQSDPFLSQRWQEVNNTATSLYIRQEDELRLSAWTTTAGLTITLNGILVTLTGDTMPFQMAFTTAGAGTRESVRSRVGPGTILYCYPTLTGGTPAVGAVTCAVEILQSDASTGPIVNQLLFGALTDKGLYRLDNIQGTATIAGTVGVSNLPTPTLLTPANPAAGANFTITVPASTTYVFQALSYKVVFSAAVANRTVNTQFLTGSRVMFVARGDTPWTAGQTMIATVGQHAQFVDNPFPGVDGVANAPGIGLVLTAGSTIQSVISGIDVADQISNITCSVMSYAA